MWSAYVFNTMLPNLRYKNLTERHIFTSVMTQLMNSENSLNTLKV